MELMEREAVLRNIPNIAQISANRIEVDLTEFLGNLPSHSEVLGIEQEIGGIRQASTGASSFFHSYGHASPWA